MFDQGPKPSGHEKGIFLKSSLSIQPIIVTYFNRIYPICFGIPFCSFKILFFVLQGIVFLEELSLRHAEGNRDYIYYLAVGNARIGNYSLALRYLKAFLLVEPNNIQVLTLEVSYTHEMSNLLFLELSRIVLPIFQDFVTKKMQREGLVGFAVASGAALVLGGLVGIGMALAKR